MDSTKQAIDQMRDAAATETYLSASRVQGHLFDLYGEVDADEAKRLVERWLTLTIQRDLFSSAELVEMLDELEERLGSSVSG